VKTGIGCPFSAAMRIASTSPVRWEVRDVRNGRLAIASINDYSHPPASTGTENSPGECKGGPPGEYGIQRQTIPGKQYVTARNSKPNHPNPKPPHLYCHIVILSCSGITPRSIKRIEIVSLFMS